jgi:hypothetical protein
METILSWWEKKITVKFDAGRFCQIVIQTDTTKETTVGNDEVDLQRNKKKVAAESLSYGYITEIP